MNTTLAQTTNSLVTKAAECRANQYLGFRLARQEFAIPVDAVIEIMGMQGLAAVREASPFVKGVIDLRGNVVAVIDFRRKFSLPEVPPTYRSRIIVVQIATEIRTHRLGLIADAVSEVMLLPEPSVANHPGSPPYVVGVTKMKGKVKTVLDVNQVLSEAEIAQMQLLAGLIG